MKVIILVVCMGILYTSFSFSLAQSIPVAHVHADYESRLTVLETNHHTFLVMVPIVLMVLAAILGVMWKSTQIAKSTTHTLELTYSNELTAITLQLTTLKNSVDRIEKLISDTVLFGPSGRSG